MYDTYKPLTQGPWESWQKFKTTKKTYLAKLYPPDSQKVNHAHKSSVHLANLTFLPGVVLLILLFLAVVPLSVFLFLIFEAEYFLAHSTLQNRFDFEKNDSFTPKWPQNSHVPMKCRNKFRYFRVFVPIMAVARLNLVVHKMLNKECFSYGICARLGFKQVFWGENVG